MKEYPENVIVIPEFNKEVILNNTDDENTLNKTMHDLIKILDTWSLCNSVDDVRSIIPSIINN